MSDEKFDKIIPRIGTHSDKWDCAKALYGVDPEKGGIPMWVADMDFAPPASVQRKLEEMLSHGVYGYYGDQSDYKAAICWWMRERHNWHIQPEWIFTTHGLVNGTSICLDAFSKEGDGIVLMTPVYHAFARVINASGRNVVECELAQEDGRYVLDIDAWDQKMSGNETMLLLCSPHNPGGRVWSKDELVEIAEFCRRHDLILVSDEIHHDLVFSGAQHIPAASIEGIEDRLVVMSATTKTFNIAGSHTGNVIIQDAKLRDMFARRMKALGISPNSFGLEMAIAAYSQEGAQWLDDLLVYLEENKRIFDEAINSISGVKSMHLEATYLAWVDFSGTGMTKAEIVQRVQERAQIAASHGDSFGKGGESFMRFNLATPRSYILEACERLKAAFSDLQ